MIFKNISMRLIKIRALLYAELLVLLSMIAPAVCADPIPHRAIYVAEIDKGVAIKGTAVRELKHSENDQWIYSFNVSSFAADIKESVKLKWYNQHLIPLEYNYELDGFFIKKRTQNIDFDWSANLATGSHSEKQWKLKLPPLALDRLGYQLQLLTDVESSLNNKSRSPFNYQIIHRGKVRHSQFEITREELLDTTLGKAETIVVEKVRDGEKKRKTTLWFSKKYPILLLKMNQIEKDGEEYNIHIKEAVVEGSKVAF